MKIKPFVLLEVKAGEKTIIMNNIDKTNNMLEQMAKGNPFRTPDGYFDNFSVRMSDKISEVENIRKPWFEWVRPQITVYLAFSSVVILFAVGIKMYQANNKPISSHEFAEVMEYSIISDMDDSEIIKRLDEANNKLLLSKDSIAKIKDGDAKTLINYLSKEDIDINAIEDVL